MKDILLSPTASLTLHHLKSIYDSELTDNLLDNNLPEIRERGLGQKIL